MNKSLFLQLQSAIELDNADLIELLTNTQPPEELMSTLMMKKETSGGSLLHLIAEGSADGSKICCFNSAVKMKQLFLPFPSDWLQLLKHQTTRGLDTVIHRAARYGMTNLIRLFSEGLTSEAWLSVLLLRNENNFTASTIMFNKRPKEKLSLMVDFANTLFNPLTLEHKKIVIAEIRMDLERIGATLFPVKKFMKLEENARKIAFFSIWAKENGAPKEITQDIAKKFFQL